MKIKPDLLNSSFNNAYLGEDVISGLLSRELYKNSFKKTQKKKGINFLKLFWNKLLFIPESFSSEPQTPINKILLKEIGISSDEMISSVLSEKLRLPINSTNLISALKETNKIFHEDYPGDFVLEYQGERLGMAILDICHNSNLEATPIYRFKPEIKNFRGLF